VLLRFSFKKEYFMKKYFDYLDRLRRSGETNMYGAVPYLQKEFPELGCDRNQAVRVLRAWMDSFQEKGGEDKC